MSSIKVARTINEIPDTEELIALISRQMISYGGDPDAERLRKALGNALKEESRSCLFLWEDWKMRTGAFVFANICSGLESGGDYLWINELYVDDSFRRRGIASEMLKFIDGWARANDLVYIACSTGLKNRAARELYSRNGFEEGETVWIDKELNPQ